jgi:hypothetical protein
MDKNTLNICLLQHTMGDECRWDELVREVGLDLPMRDPGRGREKVEIEEK